MANLVKVEFKQTNHIHVCESHNVIDIITDQIDLFELSHEEIQARGNFWSENRYAYARFGVLLLSKWEDSTTWAHPGTDFEEPV